MKRLASICAFLAVAASLLLNAVVVDARPRGKARARHPAPASPDARQPAPAASTTPASAPPATSAATKPPATDVDLHVPTRTGETRCAACHTTQGWGDVRFAHDRTGFPLVGAHRPLACKACHVADFKTRLPERCAGCHRDAHAGEFGQRCEGCHDEETWRTTFTVDAHRNTNFPLSGSHAMIPCTECHTQVRDRVFSRATVTCASCHQADYNRAAMGSIDHVAAGFSLDCRQCHNTFRFSPALFPAHNQCFRLTGGPHAGIRCLTCHSSMPSVMSLGTCSTGNATCTSCHEHACAKSNVIPAHVALPMSYQCADQKCYQCHKPGLSQ